MGLWVFCCFFVFFLIVSLFGFNLLETSKASFASLPAISLLLPSNLLDSGSIPQGGGTVQCPVMLSGHPWH